MEDEKCMLNLIDNISKNEVLKLRKSYKDNKRLDNYLFKALEKITIKAIQK